MDNYIEYIATGKCNSFQNIFYTADVATILVEINGIEIPTADYTWVYGTKFVQFDTVPDDGDRVRITDEALVSDPDPDLDILRNDVSANIANITAIEAEQVTQDATAAQNALDIDALEAADIVHDTSINNLSTDYATHEARLDAFDISTVATEAKAQQNKEDIAVLTDQEAAVTALDVRMTAAEAAIIVIEGNEVTTAAAIAALEADVAILNATLGSGDTALGTNEIDNNVTVALDLTTSLTGQDIVVDAQYCFSARLFVEIWRKTDDSTRHTNVELLFQWDGTAWEMARMETTALAGEIDGVIFSCVNDVPNQTGDLYYVSDNMSGANYESSLRFKLIKQPHTLI